MGDAGMLGRPAGERDAPLGVAGMLGRADGRADDRVDEGRWEGKINL